jgi:hypothetical protein
MELTVVTVLIRNLDRPLLGLPKTKPRRPAEVFVIMPGSVEAIVGSM